jgi:hypothetical protein
VPLIQIAEERNAIQLVPVFALTFVAATFRWAKWFAAQADVSYPPFYDRTRLAMLMREQIKEAFSSCAVGASEVSPARKGGVLVRRSLGEGGSLAQRVFGNVPTRTTVAKAPTEKQEC